MAEEDLKKWTMGIILVLFIIVTTMGFLGGLMENYGSQAPTLNSSNKLLNDAQEISKQLNQITGETSGDENFLTSVKNKITSTFMFLANLPSYYRSFFETLVIELGLGIKPALKNIIILSVTIS